MYSNNKPPVANSRNEFPSFNSVVTVSNCWYYLSLLERFVDITSSMSQDILKLYLVRAEYRYFKWMYSARYNRITRLSVPPIDIAFFWQAHLLSPVRFQEDRIRKEPFSVRIPLKEIHEAQNKPKASILDEWYLVMGDEPYDLTIEALLEKRSFASFICIICNTRARSSWEEYAQWRTDHTIALQCSCCDGMFTVKHVGKANLYKDNSITKVRISGLIIDNQGNPCQPQFVKPSLRPLKDIMSLPFNEGLQPLEDFIEKKFATSDPRAYRDRKKLIDAIQSTYLCTPYRGSSIDLIQAVARQYKFAVKVTKEVNWYPPLGIIRGIRQYASFLTVIKENKGLIAVPTYEIDLAWHTHMLHHLDYQSMCLDLVGKIINHDDNIPENDLESYVEMTDIAWEKRNKKLKANGQASPLPEYKSTEATKNRNENEKTGIRSKIRSFISQAGISDTTSQIKPIHHNQDFDEEFIFRYKYNRGNYQCPPQYTKVPEASTVEITDNFDYDTEKISFHDRREIQEFIRLNNSDEIMDHVFYNTKKSVYGFIGTSTCGNTEILNQWTTDTNQNNCLNCTSSPPSGYTKVFKTRGDSAVSLAKRLEFERHRKKCKNLCCIDKIQNNNKEESFNWYELANAWTDISTKISESSVKSSSCGGWGNSIRNVGHGGISSACGGGGGSSSCGGGGGC